MGAGRVVHPTQRYPLPDISQDWGSKKGERISYQSAATTTTDYNPLATLTFYQNFQYISFALTPGVRYYLRVRAVRC